MEFDLGLMADNAHADQSGKLYILGEFKYIFAPKLPARHGRFTVVARWIAHTVEIKNKKNTFQIEIVDADGSPVIPRSPEMDLMFGPIGPAARGQSRAQLILAMEGFVAQKYGDYSIHFFVNGSHCGEVAFHVIKPQQSAEKSDG